MDDGDKDGDGMVQCIVDTFVCEQERHRERHTERDSCVVGMQRMKEGMDGWSLRLGMVDG